MKRNYLVIPLIGLLLFGAAYGRYYGKYQTRIAAQKRRSDFAREEKLRAQQTAQAAARQQAAEALALRRGEREAEERLDATRAAERLGAEQRRAAALERERKLRARVEHAHAETKALETDLATLAQRRGALERERALLADYVKQAEGSRADLLHLAEKIERDERGRSGVPEPGEVAKDQKPKTRSAP